jgi:farnesyl diphosphate synthase
MFKMSLEIQMQQYQARIESVLADCLPDAHLPPAHLHQAMRYAVLNGGKRVRPLLVYFTGEALGLSAQKLDMSACAVELIHAYSLVHDDLPCMDDDDLRRGQATCHKAFDEATALLVGDALQTLAFQILSYQDNQSISATQRLDMVHALSLASGSQGMAGGQAMDLAAVGKTLNLAELEYMHIHKTGALIRASVQLAALSDENIDTIRLDKLEHYAKCIGLAFQIQDDILDVESDTTTLGKTQGADQARDKPTYPELVGLTEAKQMAADLLTEALHSLEGFDTKADALRALARYIINRHF